MSEQIVLRAEFREQLGKAASRRLRRLSDKVPGILYGGGVDPVHLSVAHRDLSKAMQEETFFSQILELSVGDKTQACILREVQRHPATDRVQHIDFLRIQEDMPVQIGVSASNLAAVASRTTSSRSRSAVCREIFRSSSRSMSPIWMWAHPFTCPISNCRMACRSSHSA